MAWERVWGATKSVVVDGESGAVYATPAAASGLAAGVYRWDGTPFGWTPLGGTAIDYVAAGWAPHSALYGIDPSGVVHRYDDATGQWVSIGGPTNGRARYLIGGPDQLLATAAEGPEDVYRWEATENRWNRIGGPAKKLVVGKSSDTEFRMQVYGQSPDDAPASTKGIYQWRGTWYREGGAAGDIFVSQSQLYADEPSVGRPHDEEPDRLEADRRAWQAVRDRSSRSRLRAVTGRCGGLPMARYAESVGGDRRIRRRDLRRLGRPALRPQSDDIGPVAVPPRMPTGWRHAAVSGRNPHREDEERHRCPEGHGGALGSPPSWASPSDTTAGRIERSSAPGRALEIGSKRIPAAARRW